MKYLLIISMLLSNIVFAQIDKYEQIQYYQNGKTKDYINHYNGLSMKFYDNGQRKESGFCKTNKIIADLDNKIGEWVHFKKNGDLIKIIHYNCDRDYKDLVFDETCRLKKGDWTEYYSDKKTIRQTGNIIDYKQEGEWKKFHKNGEVREIIHYKNGNRNGVYKYFNENGNLHLDGFYNDGMLTNQLIEYYDTKSVYVDCYYLYNKLSGPFKMYYPDKKIKEEGFYSEDNKVGVWKYYFENGNLKMTGIYLNNKKMGLWKRYSNDNVLLAEIEYLNGERNGFFKLYNADGIIIKNENYKNGDLVDK